MTTNRKPARLFRTDEDIRADGTHRIGVMVRETRTGHWTWAHAVNLPGGRYAVAMNRPSGARRYKAVYSEAEAWEYLNHWARATRGFAPGTFGRPGWLKDAEAHITEQAERIA